MVAGAFVGRMRTPLEGCTYLEQTVAATYLFHSLNTFLDSESV